MRTHIGRITKNIVKKLVFTVLRDFPEEWLPEGFERRLPVWGTMTGVRPTKIPMNMLLEGRERTEVMEILQNVYCCSEQKAALGTEIAAREAALLQQNEYQDGYSLYVGIPFLSDHLFVLSAFRRIRAIVLVICGMIMWTALQREIKGCGKVDAGKAADKCIYGWWDANNIMTGAASYCDKDDAGVFSDGHVCRVYSGSGKTG